MIPISLTINGIYSYRTQQYINFETLSKSGVFGIFGAVGSGKSAILDAIMLALYGETERLGKNDSRQYNMMNLQSNEMLIDFNFRLSDGSEYRSVAKSRRSKKQFEKVESIDRALYKRLESGEWEPLPVSSVEALLGINYSNFKRTVIIPQGQCMEFIQLSATERTRMMKDLFLLDKYDLYKSTTTVESQNEEQRNLLRGRLLELGDYSDELIAQVSKSLQDAINTLTNTELQLQNTQLQFKQQDAARKLYEKLLTLQTELQTLEKDLPSIVLREAFLAEYEWCLHSLSDLLKLRTSNELRHKDQQRQLQELTTQKTSQQQELEQLQILFSTVEVKHAALPMQQRLLEQLRSIGQVGKLSSDIAELEQRIEKGQKLLSDSVLQINDHGQKVETLRNTLANEKLTLPDVDALYQMQIKIDRLETVVNELDKTKKTILQTESEIKARSAQKEQLLKQIGLPYPLQTDSFEIAELSVKKQITQLEKSLEQLLIQQQLHQFAENLSDGKECPLCGATQHPNVFSAQHAATEQRSIKEQLEQLRKQLEEQQKVRMTCELLDKEQSQLRKGERELSALLHPLAIERNNLQSETENSEKQDIINKIQRAAQQKKQIETLEKDLEQLQLQYSQLLANEKKYMQLLQSLQTDCEQKRGAYKTLYAQLQEGDAVKYVEKSAQEIQQLVSELESDIINTKQQHSQLGQAISQLQTSVATLDGNCNALQLSIQQLAHELAELSNKIVTILQTSNYNTIDEVITILSKPLVVSEERAVIQKFRQQHHHLLETIATLKTDQQQQPFDAELYPQLKETLQQLETLQKQQLDAVAVQKTQLDSLKQRAQLGQQLFEQQKTLDERALNIQTLKQLFKASGFVNYVSTNYLKHLCAQANNRFFKLTKQKLQLEVDADNTFVIRDFMNNGQLRSIKTLSGGQMFQAALSLALALSDSVQHKHQQKQNFFFIDEGFGSLDKDSLRLVFESLKALRQENRIVGIISHVEELKEEIPQFLQVQNNEELGSILVENYR